MTKFAKLWDGESRLAAYTCSGSIRILLDTARDTFGALTPWTRDKAEEQEAIIIPIIIRCVTRGCGSVLYLPVQDDESKLTFEQLVHDCTPATFGRDGRDVYDETYRRADAMGIKDFPTDL